MAASLGLAGLSGCSPTAAPRERIVPYVRPPEEIVPGKPLYFATAMPFGGYGIGLIVKSHEGRPIKIEGNAKHPASLGATDTFAQASLRAVPDGDRGRLIEEVSTALRPRLYDAERGWVADYVRLRFAAERE